MNSKGQTLLVGIIVGIMIFTAGMVFLNYLMPEVATARTSLSCSSADISDGTKLLCLGVDIVVPYFIIIVISAAGGLIAAKMLI